MLQWTFVKGERKQVLKIPLKIPFVKLISIVSGRSHCDDVQCVYEFVRNGANLDAVNRSGETALHVMVRGGKFECVVALLAKGANATVKGVSGDNALHMAVEVIAVSFMCVFFRYCAKLCLSSEWVSSFLMVR